MEELQPTMGETKELLAQLQAAEAEPSDDDLARLWKWTLHTRWASDTWTGDGPVAACMCETCRVNRRKRWLKEQPPNNKDELGPIRPQRLSGEERFRSGEGSLNFNVFSFWQWIGSDLVSNTMRGVLAEYLVAKSLGIAQNDSREEWAPYDLVTQDGVTIEVKSASYIQSWKQEKLSPIVFSCPKTRAWDNQTGLWEKTEPHRQSQVYVFALLAHKDQATLDPLNLDQWEFYVLPTTQLDARGSQKSISLATLKALHGKPQTFDGLTEAVTRVLK